jgi:hypothetical protein
MNSVQMRQGQMLAGLGGILLFIFLFLPWFGVGDVSESGWEGQSSTDIFLLIVAAVAVGTAATAGGALLPGLTLNGATATLGGVATIVLLWLVVFDYPEGEDRKIGLYLSLIAVAVIAFGGFRAAQGEVAQARPRDRF